MDVRKESIYFFIAIFAVLLAGDLMWWEGMQLGMDYENAGQWAAISMNATTRLDHDMVRIEADILNADIVGNREGDALDRVLQESQ
jgi:hypothetical protein